jgi:PKD repeat protein
MMYDLNIVLGLEPIHIQQNVAIEVWGRAWDSNGPITSATLDFGDGSPVANLALGNPTNYLGTTHAYTTFGVKTVTLSVTDTDGTTTKTAKIKVLQAPSPEERINMAIEKGLLNLYKTRSIYDTNRIYWWSINGRWAPAITAVSLLAFEENGHLPGNSITEDIYADMVQKGINGLLSFKEGQNANGAYLVYNDDHGTYVNGYAAMAFFLSQPNEQAAKAAVINTPGSIFNGMTYYELGLEIVRAFSTNQGTNGAWYYPVTYRSNTLDGSSGQWPILGLLAAKERWGIPISQTVADRAFSGFRALQNGNGGIGYRNNRGYNSNRTGGLLIAGALKGVEPKSSADGGTADEDAAYRAIKYIGSQWETRPIGVTTSNNGGPFGSFYPFYGVKKGLAVIGVKDLLTTGNLGIRDWYKDFSSWALGDRNLWAPDQVLAASSGGGVGYQTAANYFGQKADGSWDGYGGYV